MYILRDNKTKSVRDRGGGPPEETASQCRDGVLRTPLVAVL